MIGIQKKLRRILSIQNLSERDKSLGELANSLGCSLTSTYEESGKYRVDEVVARIQTAARESRDSTLWLIALISAVASVISACAAWLAIAQSSQ